MIEIKKDVVSNIKIEISNHSKFEKTLKERFPDYKVKYKKFSDIYVLRNRSFNHDIWYNPNKFSKLKSKRTRELREVIIANIILLVMLFSIGFANDAYNWFALDFSIIMEIGAILIMAVNYLIYQLKPKYKEGLEEEHNNILDYLRTVNN